MELLSVKPFQEALHASMCGAASLKMVLSYYGIEKTGKEISELCGVDSKLGTDAASMKRVAESFGFSVEIKNESTFDDIELWLAKTVPVIVDWFTRGRSDYDDSAVPDGHYSLVIGLDGKYIYLQDPEIGGVRKIERDDFLSVWFDFDGSYISSLDQIIIRQLIAIYPENIQQGEL